MVQLLLKYGADPSVSYEGDQTLLEYTEDHRAEIREMLLEYQ